LQAQKEYENALTKISPSNKKLIAKTKNNLALSVFLFAQKNQDKREMLKSVLIFQEALELFKEIGDSQSSKEVETNIKEAQTAVDNLRITI
jgi:hypothetical protein